MYGEVPHNKLFVLPKQLLLLNFSVDTLTGKGYLLLTSVFCKHTA